LILIWLTRGVSPAAAPVLGGFQTKTAVLPPDFEIQPDKPAIFIFASFDGTISARNPQVNPTVAVEKVKATPGSLFTGATIAEVKQQRFLYVTDVHEGKIRVFDRNFHPIQTEPEAFEDERLPENFVAFNVQNIGATSN
jgi:hypothetical protein